mgnify:CR=1 FL=1
MRLIANTVKGKIKRRACALGYFDKERCGIHGRYDTQKRQPQREAGAVFDVAPMRACVW